MKNWIATALMIAVGSIGMAGCAEKAETKTQIKTTTPGGTTTVTTDKEVKKTGDNPP
jgi:hypothetical protein